MSTAEFNKANLSLGRRRLLYIGSLFALSVYYLNYYGNFEEGSTEGVEVPTLLMRLTAVACIVTALLPIRLWSWSSMMVQGLYLYGALSYLLTAAWYGHLTDSLFLNTIIQIPVLLALVGTRFKIDYIGWLRLIFGFLAIQVLIDILIWQAGQLLWQSSAFVGGLGNPSSFGLLCTLGVTFYIFHPSVGRERWMMVGLLSIGAFQTKAMFAVLGITLILLVWILTSWRRTFFASILGIALAIGSVLVSSGQSDDGETGFIEHKLMAVGALLSFVEYDVESSASVSQRIEMHERTFRGLAVDPLGLIIGHLKGLPYWPMDSQLLTYLGSFGAPFLILFLSLHTYWMVCAWRKRRNDNGFTLFCLFIFGLIFMTNRVLDYFPVAIIYFIIISIILGGRSQIRRANAGQVIMHYDRDEIHSVANGGSNVAGVIVPARA